MKKLAIAAAIVLLSCSDKDARVENSGANSTSNVEQNSGENISPQLHRESDERLGIDDTMSQAGETRDEKEEDDTE